MGGSSLGGAKTNVFMAVSYPPAASTALAAKPESTTPMSLGSSNFPFGAAAPSRSLPPPRQAGRAGAAASGLATDALAELVESDAVPGPAQPPQDEAAASQAVAMGAAVP